MNTSEPTLVSRRVRRRSPRRRRSARSGLGRDVDVAIIGAGAAGIAAARRIAAAGRRFALLEAADRDRRALRHRHAHLRRARSICGAHWIHMPEHQSGGEARAARPGSTSIRRRRARRLRIGRRNAREGELEDFLAALVRCEPRHPGCRARQGRHVLRAGAAEGSAATGGRRSSSCSGRSAAARISARSRRWISRNPLERDIDAFCRQGFGALLAKLAEGLPVQLVDAGHADRHLDRAAASTIETAQGPHHRARRRSSRCRPTC